MISNRSVLISCRPVEGLMIEAFWLQRLSACCCKPRSHRRRIVFRDQDRRRRRAGALSEDRRVPPAPVEDHQPRQVRGNRQDDDGESVRAGDDQRAGEPGEVESAGRDQPPARRPARAERGGREEAGAGRARVLFRLRHDPLDRGRQHAVADRDRAPAGDRQQPGHPQILDNVVVLLVPSQNPDGQYLVVDHWYKTKGTPFTRTYPDLYHKYVGHDDNRDWFMFTQKETRLALQIQNGYKPIITHDMHQMGSGGARIFVPPFDDPYDPNVHPILARASAGRAGDGGGAGVGRERRRRVAGALRPVGPGAAVHGLPRAAAHPHRDRERQPRRSADQPERRADGTAGHTLELPAAVPQQRLAAARHRGLRQHRRVRRHVARGEVPRRRGSRTSTRCTPTG